MYFFTQNIVYTHESSRHSQYCTVPSLNSTVAVGPNTWPDKEASNGHLVLFSQRLWPVEGSPTCGYVLKGRGFMENLCCNSRLHFLLNVLHIIILRYSYIMFVYAFYANVSSLDSAPKPGLRSPSFPHHDLVSFTFSNRSLLSRSCPPTARTVPIQAHRP